MKRFLVSGAVAGCLMAPASAVAAPSATGVSTNSSTRDAVGFCVSAGTYNNFIRGMTTGDERSSHAGDPGAVAAEMQGARATCGSIESPYPAPGSAK